LSQPAAIPGVDLEVLRAWMDERGLASGPIEDVEALGGGTQNILLRFRRGTDAFVLRRPPLHKRRNSDETMRREARVLGALAGSEVPHPALIAACAEEDVLGASFYLMEPIDGFNAPTGLPPLHAGNPTIRHRMGLSMVDGIAALGRIDFTKVGLEGFGRPEGFIERQVPRWKKQLASYSELSGYPGPEIPGVEQVADWLDRHKPTEWKPGILHGDYHLANVLFELDGPELLAIVDWELCTIGDPLLDLGWMLATWPDPGELASGVVRVHPWEGFPAADELVEQYRKGTDRCLDSIAWYEVLACYKLGIILEGSHARAFAGKAPKEIGDLLHRQTLGLFERALTRIATA